MALKAGRAERTPDDRVVAAACLIATLASVPGCGGLAFGCRPSEPCEPAAAEPEVAAIERAQPSPAPSEPPGRVCEGTLTWTFADIERLAGCRIVDGDLMINASAGLDLRPLHALETVLGDLIVRGTLPSNENLDALSGLESLQAVQNLYVSDVRLVDLSALRSLRSVGLLAIESCDRLENLDGLQGLEALDALEVRDNDALKTLAGIALPASMSYVLIRGNPLLASLGPPSGLLRVGEITIERNALAEVYALSTLVEAESIAIELQSGEPMRDLRGLTSLRRVGSLRGFWDRLDSLSGLDDLREANELWFMGDLGDASALADLQFSSLSLSSTTSLETLPLMRPAPGFSLDLRGNSALRRVPEWAGVTSAGSVVLSGNAVVEALSLPDLTTADQVSIRSNPALTALDLGQLSRASYVDVSCNASLSAASVAPLALVQAESVSLVGNGESNPDCLSPF